MIKPKVATNRTRALVIDTQGATFDIANDCGGILAALETQASVDARSDAHLWEVARLLGLIERDPERAVELARLAKIHQARGLELDLLEDDHRADAMRGATRARSWAQRIAGWIDAYFGVRGSVQAETRERMAS